MQIIVIISVITRWYYSQSFPAQVISDLLCALGNRVIMSFNSHQYGVISSCYLQFVWLSFEHWLAFDQICTPVLPLTERWKYGESNLRHFRKNIKMSSMKIHRWVSLKSLLICNSVLNLTFVSLAMLLLLFIKFTLRCSFSPSNHTSQVSPLVIWAHSGTQISCASTTGRWKAHSYQNCLKNTDSIFLYFAVSTFYRFSLH